MKLYISYSLGLTDLHIAGLLRQQAEASGIAVETSQHQAVPTSKWIPLYDSSYSKPTPITINNTGIASANFMIAIVSTDSIYASNVRAEINYGVSVKKPIIALVEEYLSVGDLPGVEYVYFNRTNLKPALEHIKRILANQQQKAEANKWVLAGGLALLALYLLSKDKD